MKKLDNKQMENCVGGGWDPFDCGVAIAGMALVFATIPTGIGAGLLVLGGASLGLVGMARACVNPYR